MVKIISDSTSDLSQDLLDRYNITLVPLIVRLGDQQYEDRVNITSEEIFRWSDSTKKAPCAHTRSTEATVKPASVIAAESRFSSSDAGHLTCAVFSSSSTFALTPRIDSSADLTCAAQWEQDIPST